MELQLIIKALYGRLPFPLAVRLARGRPDVAFYIRTRHRELTIDDFMGSFTVAIDTNSIIERRMLSRRYDLETEAIIRKFVRPGQRVLDVGANVGGVALALARRVGPEGRVEAFEPGPPFFERLTRNLAANPTIAGRVRAHRLGLSDEPGRLLWQPAPNDPETASIHWSNPSRPGGVEVPVTTLDAFLSEQGIEAVHFLKSDVDGMDHKVLAGGREMIARQRPVLYFETSMCDDEQREAARSIERMLDALDYRLYRITDKRGGLRPSRFPDFSLNMLALPAEADPAGVSGSGNRACHGHLTRPS